MEGSDRRIMWHGMCLFLFGLLTGFAEEHFANMRMGLAAHLEGVTNGIFLLALGTVWAEVRLPPSAKAFAFWTALCGTVRKLADNHSRSAVRYRGASPITGAGHRGTGWQEAVVSGGFHTVGIVVLASSASSSGTPARAAS